VKDLDYNIGSARVGSLRWPVTIARRVAAPDSGVSLTESLANPQTVHATIEPLGPMTWLAGMQTDRPITHRIVVRWLPGVDQTWIIVRTTFQPDMSSLLEVYRIRKIAELGGRKRFLEFMAEEETRIPTP
jgi:hypothetical protein